jgi:hypothetical protein
MKPDNEITFVQLAKLAFPKNSKTSLSKLIHKLDVVFSQFIRLRDADSNGMVTCVTCGKRMHWKESHCGHFISRDRKSTRHDVRNCSVQCPYCNTYRSGEQFKHGQHIDKKYGIGTAENLSNLGRVKCKLSRDWIIMETEKYKDLVKELIKKVS